jgi:hypothetical protein
MPLTPLEPLRCRLAAHHIPNHARCIPQRRLPARALRETESPRLVRRRGQAASKAYRWHYSSAEGDPSSYRVQQIHNIPMGFVLLGAVYRQATPTPGTSMHQ